jgi:hypothetical protein
MEPESNDPICCAAALFALTAHSTTPAVIAAIKAITHSRFLFFMTLSSNDSAETFGHGPNLFAGACWQSLGWIGVGLGPGRTVYRFEIFNDGIDFRARKAILESRHKTFATLHDNLANVVFIVFDKFLVQSRAVSFTDDCWERVANRAALLENSSPVFLLVRKRGAGSFLSVRRKTDRKEETQNYWKHETATNQSSPYATVRREC